ncbi:uncharacterized protein [Eleutherodactylus coqui]|uniref:uncharacterized protein isoform X2 n=2 Tax=Eleutherodactylus coqui TaxID=57060 RepID=UPI00346285FA
MDISIRQFIRRLRLRTYFASAETNQTSNESIANATTSFSFRGTGLRNPSKFQPPVSDAAVDVYKNLVNHDITRLRDRSNRRRIRPNMSKAEWLAINSLSSDDSITIRPADKGGAIIIMDSQYYHQELSTQLSDTLVYEVLTSDPTSTVRSQLKLVLDQARSDGLIDQQLLEFMYPEYPILAKIYTIPKVHKDIQRPPGRPIVSGRGSLFNNVSRFLDVILRQHATEATSYIKDTSDFLCKLERITVREEAILASFDVSSLYTIIQHEVGTAAVEFFLSRSTLPEECVNLVRTLLLMVLSNNFFLYCGKLYRQLQGTAMGSNMAPSYANIYMRYIEETRLCTSPAWAFAQVWWRYIDDVFLIWNGSMEQLKAFHEEINNLLPELKFTLSASDKSIQFLDVLIIKQGSGLVTDLYTKPTDRNNLLQYSSCHPPAMMRSLPWSQMLRVRRVVSDEFFDDRLEAMCRKFAARGYPQDLLSKQTYRVKQIARTSILSPSKSNKATMKRIPFVSTYGAHSGEICSILNKHWHVLARSHPDIVEFTDPPMMAYRRARNLKDRLVCTSSPGPSGSIQRTLAPIKNGNFPCLGCASCHNMVKGDSFAHPRTGKRFRIRGWYSCWSAFVVYLISCPCGLQYVGQTTTEVRKRMSNHKSNIRTRKLDLPIPRHFEDHNHSISQFRFMVIDSVERDERGGDRERRLKLLEAKWIFRFLWVMQFPMSGATLYKITE